MIRRALRQVSVAAVMSWTWHHRGSAVRVVDLVCSLPDRIRNEQVRDVVTEAKVIRRLDTEFAADTRVRVGSLTEGQIVLRDGVDPAALGTLRRLLAPVAGVSDVRTDVAHQPTVADALAS